MVNTEQAEGGVFLVFSDRDERTGRYVLARHYLTDRDRLMLADQLLGARAR